MKFSIYYRIFCNRPGQCESIERISQKFLNPETRLWYCEGFYILDNCKINPLCYGAILSQTLDETVMPKLRVLKLGIIQTVYYRQMQERRDDFVETI